VAILPAGAVRGNDSGAVSVPLAGVQARREIGMSWRLSAPLTPAASVPDVRPVPAGDVT
jgi:hypothetical protein